MSNASAAITRNPMRAAVEVPAIDPNITAFHARMPAYSPTMLFDVPELAQQLGVGRLRHFVDQVRAI